MVVNQLLEGNQNGNCKEGCEEGPGQEGRCEEGPREEGGTGEEGRCEEGSGEEGRSREEGGTGKEGCSREEGGEGPREEAHAQRRVHEAADARCVPRRGGGQQPDAPHRDR